MKIALRVLLFALISISYISCQTFPSNYKTLWNTLSSKIVAADCNVDDYKKPFPKCDSLYGNLTISDFIKASSNTIVTLLTSNNKDDMYTTFDLFCKAADSYVKCMKAANKLCSKNLIWKKVFKVAKRSHPIYRLTLDFCKKGKLSKVYAAQKAKVDTKTCLVNTRSRLSDEIDHFKDMINKTKELFYRDPDKVDTADFTKKLTVLCSVSTNLKRIFAIISQSCSKEVKILLFKLTQWIFPSEIYSKCKLPNDNPNTFSKPYGRNNKNRITVYIFGGFHKYRNKETSLETCTFNDNENVNIIELDKLQMTCTAGVLNNNYTFIKSCSVTFFDNNRNKIDSLDYSSTGVMSKTFTLNGGTSLGPKVSKGKGKALFNITLTTVKPNLVRIIDRNTGVSISILLFTSEQKVNIYSIIIRLTSTANDAAIGQFSRPCLNSVKLGNKRGKRAAGPSTAAQANYDSKSLNDPNANSMSTNVLQEINGIVATDSIFKAANMLLKVSIFTTILPTIIILLFY